MDMEPLERSVSHGTDTESLDTMATNQSIGPALVGNISVDSLDGHNNNTFNKNNNNDQPEPTTDTPEPEQLLEDKPQVQLPQPELEVQSGEIDLEHPREGDRDLDVEEHLAQEEPQQQSAPPEEIKYEQYQDQGVEDKEQGEQHQQQQQQQQQQPLMQEEDQSARRSSSESSEVQVQDIKREEEEREHTHELKTEEGEKEENGEKGDEKEEKVGIEEQKVEFSEEDLKQELLEPQLERQHLQDDDEDEDDEDHQKLEPSDTSFNLIKLHDNSNNDLFHHTFKTAANTSRSSQQFGDELEDDTKNIMEFAKNYSDDLISNELNRATSGERNNESSTGGPDLADFELPPYSGSSSGSDQTATKHSPAKQRKSSNPMATQASSSYQAPGSSASTVAHDLSAVKDILLSTYSKTSHIFHWKRPIESGVIFASGLTLIIALTFFSIISVVAYTALGVIFASGLLRIYKTGMKALNRSSETPVDHIWNKALGLNVSLSSQRLHELVDSSYASFNASMIYFKQVLLVEDKIATFKFFVFLYSLTYIGSWFNGLTLITLIYLALFTVPLLYEKNKTNIDQYVNLATKQITSSISMVTDRVGSILGSQAGGGSKKKD